MGEIEGKFNSKGLQSVSWLSSTRAYLLAGLLMHIKMMIKWELADCRTILQPCRLPYWTWFSFTHNKSLVDVHISITFGDKSPLSRILWWACDKFMDSCISWILVWWCVCVCVCVCVCARVHAQCGSQFVLSVLFNWCKLQYFFPILPLSRQMHACIWP